MLQRVSTELYFRAGDFGGRWGCTPPIYGDIWDFPEIPEKRILAGYQPLLQVLVP